MAWGKPRYRDFTGGESLKLLPEALLPNQVFRAQNCVITSEGVLETRLGRTKVNSVSLGSGGIISVHRYSKEDGTRYLVVQHGTSLYSKEWGGVTPFTSFGAAVNTGLDTAKLRSLVWKDKLILTNGVDRAFTFDGAACTEVAAIPICKALYLYAGRLWCVDEATGFLENSNLEDYTNWSESGSYKVRDGDGDRIAALSPQNGGLVIFKQNTVQPLYGTNKNNIVIKDPFSRRVGCVAIDSVLDDGLFMGKDNLYEFSLTGVAPRPETHTPFFSTLTLAQKSAAFAIPHATSKRAVVNIGGADLCVHAQWGGAITTWAGMNAGCYAVADDKDDSGALIIGDATDGYVYIQGGSTDDGTALETRIKSVYLDHNMTGDKEWASFVPDVTSLESTPYRMYYNYDLDYVSGGMLTGTIYQQWLTWGQDKWGTQPWGAESRVNEPFFLHDARGTKISFEVVCNNRIQFHGFTTRYRPVGAKI